MGRNSNSVVGIHAHRVIGHVHRNAMNIILTTDEYWYGIFGHGNVVIGMRNVVMMFTNMGMGMLRHNKMSVGGCTEELLRWLNYYRASSHPR